MSQFITDPKGLATGGLFSLNSMVKEGGGDVGAFKLAMGNAETTTKHLATPIGLAVAQGSLPLGKQLPPNLTVLSEASISQIELEQLSFASDALGLKLPTLLQDKYSSLLSAVPAFSDLHASEETTGLSLGELTDPIVDEVSNKQAIDLSDRMSLMSDEAHTESSMLEVSVEDLTNQSSSSSEYAAVVGLKSELENVLKDESTPLDVSEIAITSSVNIAEQSVILEEGLTEDQLDEFVSQLLQTEVSVLADTNLKGGLTEASVKKTLGSLIAENPQPQNWSATTFNVVNSEIPKLGTTPNEVKPFNLLQIINQNATKLAESNEFLAVLTSKGVQAEVSAKNILQHFTSQLKTDVDPSLTMVKEGVDLASAARISPESLRFMQNLLERSSTQQDSSSNDSNNLSSLNMLSSGSQRSPLQADASLMSKVENSPLNPMRAEFHQQMEQRIQWMLSRGVQTADIRIDPPELGTIHIRVAQHGDQTQVVFTSQHANVREALEGMLPRLREMFEQQGLNLGQTDVRDQGGQSQSGDSNNPNENEWVNDRTIEDVPADIVSQSIGLVDTHV